MHNNKPVVGITMGDASGIGPEIIAKTLSRVDIYEICKPLVIGERETMSAATDLIDVQNDVTPFERPSQGIFQCGNIDVLDLANLDFQKLSLGEVSPQAGKAAYEYIIRAADLALSGGIDAVVTAPINKGALDKAGFMFSGHTEILATHCGVKDVSMMLVAEKLRVSHVTTHVSLRGAIKLVKKERVYKVIQLTDRALRSMGIPEPRIAVAGLNPHAGEEGLFGTEEIDEIAPAIQRAVEEGINAYGPVPGDTVFFQVMNAENSDDPPIDGIVVMYHDQGHIPVKLLGFFEGVNITLGLPIIRTSVDHGTAFDKAWKGIANPESLVEAIRLAVRMVSH